MKAALALVLATGLAEAAPRPPLPTYADVGPGPSSDIDDNALAQDLRAAFGKEVSHCTTDRCELRLAELWCTLEGTDTVCRATDRLARDAARIARGAAARRLVIHLRNIGVDQFDVDRWAAYMVGCGASIPNAETGQSPDFPMHGHCNVELKHGDATLLEGFQAVENSKLGGMRWTGRLRVRCAGQAGPCTARPDPTVDPDSPDGWLERSIMEGAATITDRAACEMLWRRAGTLETTVDCRAWRSQQWDGGTVDVVGCGVLRR